jgi:hypothetical protein
VAVGGGQPCRLRVSGVWVIPMPCARRSNVQCAAPCPMRRHAPRATRAIALVLVLLVLVVGRTQNQPRTGERTVNRCAAEPVNPLPWKYRLALRAAATKSASSFERSWRTYTSI